MTAPADPPERRLAVPEGGVAVALLAERLGRVPGGVRVLGRPEPRITSIEFDHRKLKAPGRGALATEDPPRGALFCCLPGRDHDGHEYAAAARANGAAAFLCERDLGDSADGAIQLVVGPDRAREAMAHAACAFWGDPALSLKTIGVTGTNGKTTTTWLLSSILAEAGYEARVLGTLTGVRTTPESPELQEGFEAARRAAAHAGRPAAVALEVTSHGMVQHRVDGYAHDVVVFTNLSQDHLDYHHTMEEYFEAKAGLFTSAHAVFGVVNADDEYGRRLLDRAGIAMKSFSRSDAIGLEVGPRGSVFWLRGHEVHLSLLGSLNVENAIAAAAAARALGIEDAVIARGLGAVTAVPGRFEHVENSLGLTVVVDYAHTPSGLAQACATLQGLLAPRARLIVVFGAGGDRDRDKRPQMGHAVCSVADVVVVTTDNPRHEEPGAIIEEVLSGCDGRAELHVESDRRKAIALGLVLATRDDVVLVAGKGHETSQQFGDELIAFDDRSVVVEESDRLAGAA
ncbi:MAG: UDP-N-acetylmuramoyl-L-alanyl-D-glutamate--2,6-diaminopimelate ligase [Acidimicrobiales bacterium]